MQLHLAVRVVRRVRSVRRRVDFYLVVVVAVVVEVLLVPAGPAALGVVMAEVEAVAVVHRLGLTPEPVELVQLAL